MEYYAFVTNDHFRQLASVIRPAYSPDWQNHHPKSDSQFLLAQARDVATEEAFSRGTSRDLFSTRICQLLVAMVRADDSLSYAAADLDWFITQMSEDDPAACAAMSSLLLAYASAPIR